VFAALQGIFMLHDIYPNFAGRAQGTFLNSNMGSNYLGLSFFLLFYSYAKAHKFLTRISGFFILTGMIATKSLAGIIGFFIGTLAMMVLYWYRTGVFNKIKLISIVLIIAIIGVAIYPEVAKAPNLLSRFQKTSFTRSHILRTGIDVFIKNPLGYGIGPAGFKEVGPEIERFRSTPKKMGLHNDWLSFLVERGIIGFFGIVLLFGAIARMLFRIMKTVDSKRELMWVIGLYGMFIFALSFSLTHETLHFRHVWCLFALIAVEYKLRKKKGEQKQLTSKS
jgi:O-antigen ligase